MESPSTGIEDNFYQPRSFEINGSEPLYKHGGLDATMCHRRVTYHNVEAPNRSGGLICIFYYALALAIMVFRRCLLGLSVAILYHNNLAAHMGNFSVSIKCSILRRSRVTTWFHIDIFSYIKSPVGVGAVI
jgi:hypothetical protein